MTEESGKCKNCFILGRKVAQLESGSIGAWDSFKQISLVTEESGKWEIGNKLRKVESETKKIVQGEWKIGNWKINGEVTKFPLFARNVEEFCFLLGK